MRPLAIGIVWAHCPLGVASQAASLDDLPQKATPTLPGPRIQPTTPTPDSPLTNPNLRSDGSCTSFGSGHVCYDGHEGTDFTLGVGAL